MKYYAYMEPSLFIEGGCTETVLSAEMIVNYFRERGEPWLYMTDSEIIAEFQMVHWAYEVPEPPWGGKSVTVPEKWATVMVSLE